MAAKMRDEQAIEQVRRCDEAMSTTTLADHLRQKNRTGLAYEDAVQLFLWMYCSIDVVPDAFRSEAVSKASLVRTFEELTQSGFVRKPGGENASSAEISWRDMVDALLSHRVQLDQAFRARIGQLV